jgi:hypothetical protein
MDAPWIEPIIKVIAEGRSKPLALAKVRSAPC